MKMEVTKSESVDISVESLIKEFEKNPGALGAILDQLSRRLSRKSGHQIRKFYLLLCKDNDQTAHFADNVQAINLFMEWNSDMQKTFRMMEEEDAASNLG